MVTATPCKVRCECRGHLFCQVLADCSRDLKKKKKFKDQERSLERFCLLEPSISCNLHKSVSSACQCIKGNQFWLCSSRKDWLFLWTVSQSTALVALYRNIIYFIDFNTWSNFPRWVLHMKYYLGDHVNFCSFEGLSKYNLNSSVRVIDLSIF